MRKNYFTLGLAITVVLASINSARANDKPGGGEIVADAMLVRPLCFATTVAGSAVFVAVLPFTAIFGLGVRNTADALVGKPGRATFTRPMGEFNFDD
jgi:hypothetical protein